MPEGFVIHCSIGIMNFTDSGVFNNVTQEIVDTTTQPVLVEIVKSLPSWHMSVGVGIRLLSLVLAIITSVIVIIEHKWAAQERNAKQQHKDIAIKTGESVQSFDSVVFSISSECQRSLSIDSFFSIEETDS